MSGRILIVHNSPERAVELESILNRAGFTVFVADGIGRARELLHRHPDLLLFDMDLARTATSEQLDTLAGELELAETFCLRIYPEGRVDTRLRERVPFACGSVPPPGTAEQLLELVATLLRVKQAEHQRNLAQERLLLQRMEVEEGLRSAAQIQHALLPEKSPNLPAFSFAWQFKPCESVGGDLFNLLQLSEDVLLAYMLDVSGHGVSSAMVTVSVYQSLSDRTSHLVKQPLDVPPYFRINRPAEVLTGLDREYPYERFEKFFTIAYLLLEPASGRVRYANGGHPPSLLVRADGTLEKLAAGGTLVGLGGLVPYEEDSVQLAPGDRLYLYSDGVTEHENGSGEMFGEQRLSDFFCRQQQLPLAEGAERFVEDLLQFGEDRAPVDDISLLCIQYNGSAGERPSN